MTAWQWRRCQCDTVTAKRKIKKKMIQKETKN